MSRIFITGSSDGLGLLAAKELIAQGHQVVLHARNEKRKKDTIEKIPGAEIILTGDLSSIEETKQLAGKVNGIGKFDAVIHNAGVYTAAAKDIFTVNVLAPYLLTILIDKPERLIYLSSGMHNFGTLKTTIQSVSYSDSKFMVLLMCKAFARKWPDVYSNAVNPGWVPTKMGGKGAPDDLEKGYETQVWLATSDDEKTNVSGKYFFHKKTATYNPEAGNVQLQNKLIEICEAITDGN